MYTMRAQYMLETAVVKEGIFHGDPLLNSGGEYETAQQLPQAVLLPPSPSFSFLALAGEIRPQPSLIPACQSVCPCLA